MADKKKQKKGKKSKKDKAQNRKKDLMHIDAAEQRDVGTTHGLVTRSINMSLAAGITASREKDGDPNIDINWKAVDAGIRWCTYNQQKAQDAGIEELGNSLEEIEKIRQEQADKVISINRKKAAV